MTTLAFKRALVSNTLFYIQNGSCKSDRAEASIPINKEKGNRGAERSRQVFEARKLVAALLTSEQVHFPLETALEVGSYLLNV